MSRAPWFILPLLSSITDFFTLSGKPGPLPQPNPALTSPAWCGDGATASFSACEPSGCPLTPHPRTRGRMGLVEAGVPSKASSPHSEPMSAGQRLDARATHSPGSKSLANRALTFPWSNSFDHFWECQRNNRTSVAKPSPTCLNSPCYSMIWNHLSLQYCHQVASCSNPSDSFIMSGSLCA